MVPGRDKTWRAFAGEKRKALVQKHDVIALPFRQLMVEQTLCDRLGRNFDTALGPGDLTASPGIEVVQLEERITHRVLDMVVFPGMRKLVKNCE